MRPEIAAGASDGRSVVAMLNYIRPEVRLIDPIAAFFLSLAMETLGKNPSASAHPCRECRSTQTKRRDEASEKSGKIRRKALA